MNVDKTQLTPFIEPSIPQTQKEKKTSVSSNLFHDDEIKQKINHDDILVDTSKPNLFEKTVNSPRFTISDKEFEEKYAKLGMKFG